MPHRYDGDCLSKKVILRVDGASCYHRLPQRTSRAGIQPLPHHFLLLHYICSFPILGNTSNFSESGKALEVSNQIRSMGGGVAAPHGHTPASLSGKGCYCVPHAHPSLASCSGWGLARNPGSSTFQKVPGFVHLWSLQSYPRGLGSICGKTFLSGSTHHQPRKAKMRLRV